MPLSERTEGRLLMLLSTIAFAAMGLLVRFLPPEITSHQKVFFRGVVGFFVLAAWVGPRLRQIGWPTNIPGLMWRGIYGTISLLSFFYAIDHIGLIRATLYCYTYPVWAALFAWLDLKERPTRRELFCLALALGGTVLTLETRGGVPQLGIDDAIGILGGMMSGAAMTSVRKLHRTDNSLWIVISFTAVTMIITSPIMVFKYVAPSPLGLLLLVLVALAALLAQLLLTFAYRHLPAVEGSVISLSTLPFSAILAMLFLNETLTARFWLGAALTFSAIVLLTAWKPQKSAEEAPID